jgi:hypothetical protein
MLFPSRHTIQGAKLEFRNEARAILDSAYGVKCEKFIKKDYCVAVLCMMKLTCFRIPIAITLTYSVPHVSHLSLLLPVALPFYPCSSNSGKDIG